MISGLRKFIPFSLGESQFIRSTFKLVLGTGIAQVISFAASPVLTRLYSPDDFGQFTFFTSIFAAFALIATLRYELAIISTKEDRDSGNVVLLSGLICSGISVLLLILVLVHRIFLSGVIPVTHLMGQWFLLLPVIVLILGFGNIMQGKFFRRKEYKLISIDRVLNSGVNNITAILLGFISFGAWGLLIGNMAGALVFLVFFLVISIVKKQWNRSDLTWKSVKEVARKHKDLPASNTPQAVSDMLQNYGIIFLTKIFFTSSVVGLYALSMRILQAPLWLLGNAIMQVFFKDASEECHKSGNVHGMVRKTIKISALAVLPVMILLVVGGPWLFAFLFGQSWREAGVFSRILAPWMFFDFIRFTISQTPLLLGKARSMFFVSLAGNVCMIVSLVFGGVIMKDARTGYILLSCLMSLYAMGVILWIYRLSYRHAMNPS
jgi:O-antigen/teichoic acid export membrane protein